jgi:hypothetical protein
MRFLRLIAVVLGPRILGAVSVATGCGGSEFVLVEAGVGSPDRDTSAGPDALTEGGSTFCDSLRAYYASCPGFSAPCDQRNLANCGVYSAALSDVARTAFVTCQQEGNLTCARGAAWVHDPCVRGVLVDAKPTPEQATLARDYCTTCPQTATGCSTTFFNEGFSALADGPGFDSLLYNDVLVRAVDRTCVSNALSCGLFRVCEDNYLRSQVPADACGDSG